MSAQLQVTYFTRETVRHAPVVSLLRRHDQFTLETWWRDHEALQLLTEEERETPRGHNWEPQRKPDLELWPLCAACDWEKVQKYPGAAAARVEIKRRVRQFERTGKFPPGWLAPDLVKFGGVKMGEKEASRVVLPRIPLSPAAGSASYLDEHDRVIEDPVRRYLDSVNRIGSRILVTPEQEQYRQRTRRWRCGCTVDERKSDGTWVYCGVTPCKKHKGALEGREGE